ncbi:MAG: DUF4112 domain-containing protein [Bacteriovoracaceae bacterium]|nr:DUF4112 domain-containing protein [Bacteriovoracaceae bacterium]
MKKQKLKELQKLSSILDSKFEAPFGFRFGLDALIGLIPVIGDWIGAAMSIYIISQAASMGVGNATLIRMAINVALENIIDMIPVVGNVFDFYWKANNRNIELLENHLQNPPHETIKSRMIVGIIAVAMLLLLFATGYVTYIIIETFVDWVTSINVQS